MAFEGRLTGHGAFDRRRIARPPLHPHDVGPVEVRQHDDARGIRHREGIPPGIDHLAQGDADARHHAAESCDDGAGAGAAPSAGARR